MRRITLAILIGIAAALVCWLHLIADGSHLAYDLSWPLRGAVELLTGHTPYASTAPYRALSPAEPQYWPLYYPLPALLAVAPLTWLPMPIAGILFVGLSSALLAYGALPEPRRLLLFVSYPFWASLLYVQWAPLLTAALFLPALAPLLLCKPNVGLPILLAHPPRTRRAWLLVAVSAVLLLASIPLGWLSNTRTHENFTPLFVLPFGPLILLSVLRWRDPRARLLLAIAVMPQRFYDGLALLTVPASLRATLFVITIGWVPYLLLLVGWDIPKGALVWVLYLPALATVLYPGVQRLHDTIFIQRALVVEDNREQCADLRGCELVDGNPDR